MKTTLEIIISKSNEIINSINFMNESRTEEKHFTRNRKMNFTKIMYFCLNFIKKSLQLELDDYMELIESDKENLITKQAFSKARQNISPKAFESLFHMTSETLLNNVDCKRYKGYRIFAIDGTELELTRSKELAEHYPPAGHNTTAPRARVSIMCDVINGHIIHADFQPLTVGERTLAMGHLEYYKTITTLKNSKDLFVFDRGYPSKDLIEYFERNNIKYLMRLQRSFNREIESTNKKDFYVKLINHKSKINVRVIKLFLPSGEEEVLITNLGRKAFGKAEFKKLYSLRWGVETKYNALKNKFQLESFSGKTEVSVLQDFFATMYLSNIASAIKFDTDEKICEDSLNKNLSNTYETNEGLLIGKLKNNLVLILMNNDPQQREALLNKLINRISSFKVAVVDDRHFPRPGEAHKKTRSKVKRVI